MRRNYTRDTPRDPYVYFDHIYSDIPSEPETLYQIDRARKLIIHNISANPYIATPKLLPWPRTCFDEETDDLL